MLVIFICFSLILLRNLFSRARIFSLSQVLILLNLRKILDFQRNVPIISLILRCSSKKLRNLMMHFMSSQLSLRNSRLSKFFLFGSIEDDNEFYARRMLKILIKQYETNHQRDSKTANVIAISCFSRHLRVMIDALTFFIKNSRSSYSLKNKYSNKYMKNKKFMDLIPFSPSTIHKNRKYRPFVSEKIERETKLQCKKISSADNTKEHFISCPVSLLRDPSTFAENLFNKLNVSGEETRVNFMMIRVIARVISVHKLTLKEFYSFLLKLINPESNVIILICTLLLQATHALIPCDILQSILSQISNHILNKDFGLSIKAIALRLIYQICIRQPLAMTTKTLDVIDGYKRFRNAEIRFITKSLLSLFKKTHNRPIRYLNHSQRNLESQLSGPGALKPNIHAYLIKTFLTPDCYDRNTKDSTNITRNNLIQIKV